MMENPAATLPQTQSTVVRGESGMGRTEQGLCSAGEELEGSWRGAGGELEVMAPPSPTHAPYPFLFCGDSFWFGCQIGLTGTSIHEYNSVP